VVKERVMQVCKYYAEPGSEEKLASMQNKEWSENFKKRRRIVESAPAD
jgi:hypothetical protein